MRVNCRINYENRNFREVDLKEYKGSLLTWLPYENWFITGDKDLHDLVDEANALVNPDRYGKSFDCDIEVSEKKIVIKFVDN